MNTADIAVIANSVVDLALVGAGWHLVKSGRVRLSSPSVAQMQAGQQEPNARGETRQQNLGASDGN